MQVHISAVQGCLEQVEDRITYYAPILIGIGLGVAMVQVEFLFYLFFLVTAYCVVCYHYGPKRHKSLLHKARLPDSNMLTRE